MYVEKRINAKLKKLTDTAKNPFQGSELSSGYDLFVDRVEDHGDFVKVFTGVSIQPQKGYYFLLYPRSSVYKKGLMLYNGVGVIDADYTGEIIVIFKKGSNYQQLRQDERVAQLVPQEFIRVNFLEVDSFEETKRGDGGFGSTN